MQFQLFPTATYTNRRTVLLSNMPSGLIVLMGNEETGMNYRDNWYPFRQDSSFLYYFGIPVAGLAAILDVDSGEVVLFGNELSMDDIIWTGPLPTVKEMAAAAGVSNTEPASNIQHYISRAQKAGRPVHFLPPYRSVNTLKLADWLHMSPDHIKSAASILLIKAIIQQRSYKEPVEVEELDKAVSISADMHMAAITAAQPGMYEYELAAKVEAAAFAANARLSYPVILTINGQVLHNHYHGNQLTDGKMILLDAGAENAMHYAGDLTRTFPVGKKFTSAQAELYEVVNNALDNAISLLKPGITYKEVHGKASEKLLEGLKAVGIVKGDPAAGVEQGVHTLFFQCGLGHMMGLDVHDMEDLGEQYVGYSDTIKKGTAFGWKSLRLGRELEPGFVLTVEPGIYMIPELIDQWTAEKKLADFIDYQKLQLYRDFSGIRIEDNYLITENGSRRLGKYLPRTLQEIEALR